jgi:MoaA/NifB/PqqE/SkfB family radical SAM enzyme
MNLKNTTSTIKILPSFIRCSVFKQKKPLEIFQRVSYRCNLRCKYCGLWRATKKEMTTCQIKKAMKEFGSIGTRFWEFGGGEPLLRSDIGELIDYAKKQGISFRQLVTNGYFFEQKIDELKNLTKIYFSLDGPKDVHERIRGKGSYDKVIRAIELAIDSKLNPAIISVLSIYNLNNNFSGLKWLLNFIKKTDIQINIQPIFPHQYCNDLVAPLMCKEKYIKALEMIKKFKQETNLVRNSTSVYDIWINGLNGNSNNLKCWGGIAFASLFPDGSLAPCFYKEKESLNAIKNGFLNTFNKLQSQQNCRCISCYNENNLLYSLNFEAVKNTFFGKLRS